MTCERVCGVDSGGSGACGDCDARRQEAYRVPIISGCEFDMVCRSLGYATPAPWALVHRIFGSGAKRGKLGKVG